MATKQTLTVTTDAGTFTRTTARTYTHVVVVAGYADAYRAKLTAMAASTTSEWERDYGSRHLADPTIETPGALSWCGSLPLARKEANSRLAKNYRDVRIFEVATGREVR